MKKSLLIIGLAVTLFSCNQEQSATGFKTAYIDTVKLMEGYEELKDLDDKRKVKTEEMGRELDESAQQLRLDYASAQNEAKSKGPQWAQLKAQELQKRERELGMRQESMIKELQDEFGVKRDTILNQMRRHIKDYGKKNGYDYIYGTGDAASVLYAKESYDITKEVLKELNNNYSGSAKTETTEAKEVKDTAAAK
jgi:outer membrane protein